VKRRTFLKGTGLTLLGTAGLGGCGRVEDPLNRVCVLSLDDYRNELAKPLVEAFRACGMDERVLKGFRVLLKPNLVETVRDVWHINTNPFLVVAAVEALRSLGAGEVLVGEGSGHSRDTHLVVANSGFKEVLRELKVPFVDLNYDRPVKVAKRTNYSKLPYLLLPQTLFDVDLVVSMPKLKTHHWAGVTLGMKNLFGVMPGCVYGWPKNVLHHAGLEGAIVDIFEVVRPALTIVDGIVGMEGDGPIMGSARSAGVVVVGRSVPQVDATCAELMEIPPERVRHLRLYQDGFSDRKLVGEPVSALAQRFVLDTRYPAQAILRSTSQGG